MVSNFHELYQRYTQDVYRFACWPCGDGQDAEDSPSEICVRALTTPGEIRVKAVKAYLRTIAWNLAFKKIRREMCFILIWRREHALAFASRLSHRLWHDTYWS